MAGINKRGLPGKLKLIIIIGIAARIIFAAVFIDFEDVNYWEYGEIAKNVIEGKDYSLFYFSGGGLEYLYAPESNPFPSAYMPPGYTYFLLPFVAIEGNVLRNILIFSMREVHLPHGAFELVSTLFSDPPSRSVANMGDELNSGYRF